MRTRRSSSKRHVRNVWRGAAIALCLGTASAAGSDFDEYVATIRKAGATESAQETIGDMASSLAGGTVFIASRDGDSIGRSCTNTLCPRPGANMARLRELQQVVAEKERAWAAFLKRFADDDRSGFVTTAEGDSLRRKVEAGLIAAQMTDLKDASELANLLRVDVAQLRGDLADYGRLRSAAADEHLQGVPSLPPALVTGK